MVKIFIEAKDKRTPESEFLKAILDKIGVASDTYEIITTDGYTNLLDSADASNINSLRANSDAGGINLVVFDADTDYNKGGFAKRGSELLSKRDYLGLVFELFLWPDNKHDGDVEVLMESIARKDLYPEVFECFEKYEHCISKRKNEQGDPFYVTPNRKNKLHTYFSSLPISRSKKKKAGRGAWLWDDANIWDLDSESLNPIKDFLTKYLH